MSLWSRISALFSEKLGRCPRCMGLSLALALAGGMGTAVAILADQPLLVLLAAVAFALVLSAWFVAHLAAFTLRALRSEVTPCSHCGGGGDRKQITRRHLIGIAGQAVAAATILSIMNLPGARVFAQVGKCEDVGGPLHIFDEVCVGRDETEEQVKKRLEDEAKKWIEDNKGTFEATARGNCRGKECKGDARCVAVHYTVSYAVHCRDNPNCESRRSCVANVGMGVRCRCLPRECSSTKFEPPIEITSEVCVDKQNPTKEELQVACTQAGQQAVALAEAAAARACEQEPCPPVGGTTPPCKPDKIKATKPEVKRVKERPNCCRATVVLTGVQCKCAE